MLYLPASLQNLIEAFSALPGIGPKSAQRLAFYLLSSSDNLRINLANALENLKINLYFCPICENITDRKEKCAICADMKRDQGIICVVETPLDALVLSKAEYFNGVFHVLHGKIAPLDGVGPEDLKIPSLLARLKKSNSAIQEIIIATNPSLEGEATAMHLKKQLEIFPNLKITRIARGLPTGAEMQWADLMTLENALKERQSI